MSGKPIVLIILDGWGVPPASATNPITSLSMPFWQRLKKEYPYSTLHASGNEVGLPQGQAGNSEAGHMNLGSGRIVEQDSMVISKSISNGTFFKNPAFTGAVRHVKRNKSSMHAMGIISGRQSPHMDPDHLLALLTLLKHSGVPKVWLHLFTDGRDSYYHRGIEFIEKIVKEDAPKVEVATIMGRLYLDRKKNWERTHAAYNAMILGQGLKFKSAADAVAQAYARGETDEFISPSVIVDRNGHAKGRIKNNDATIFFNLRSDRARQLTKIFVQKQFEKKNPGTRKRKKVMKNIYFVAMTDFGPDLNNVITAYPSGDIEDTLPFVLKEKKQLYIAESEKFAHITYFFNGGYSYAVAGETRSMIVSPKVNSYKGTPAMKTPNITSAIIKGLGAYDFIAANFASPDMIGHTGDMKVAQDAVRIVIENLEKIAQAIDKKNGLLFITADHGNIEEMVDTHTNEVNTQHSHNLVPFIVYGKRMHHKQFKNVTKPKLADVAPTIIHLFGMKQPVRMTGRSLV